MEEIKVYLIQHRGRKNLEMRYADPMTGRHVNRSTGTASRKEAERAAAKWEAELRKGRYQGQSRITWSEFRDRYETEVLRSLTDETGRTVASVFNVVQAILKPDRPRDLNAARLSYFQAKLREPQPVEALLSHLRQLAPSV